jgi:eukaryotic-like serine/threonine-protein kinase
MSIAWDLLERYRVLRLLARSDRACVYVARNLGTRRVVALKVLEPAYVRALKTSGRLRAAERFADARAPGAVAIEAVRCTADDKAYVASDLLEGLSLAARLGRGPLPVADAVALCRDVAAALCEAHDHGVVHGGVRASNVFVVSDARTMRGERALIADVGLAAPRGKAVSLRTDARDLASLLHELVTGRAHAGPPDLRALPAAVAHVISRAWDELSIDAIVEDLDQLIAARAYDADPTEAKLPLRSPPEADRAEPLPHERTAMFALIDPDALGTAA